MTDSDWARDILQNLILGFEEGWILKHCKLGRVLVYTLSLPRKVVANVKMVRRSLDGYHHWGLRRDQGRIRMI
jgi:hypothetical protein